MLSVWILNRLNLTPRQRMRLHGVAMDLWLLMIPVAIITSWLFAVAFISACSLYANFGAHFSGYEAARTDENTPDE